MVKELEQIMREVFFFFFLTTNQIPSIDLYMDQVLTLINTR